MQLSRRKISTLALAAYFIVYTGLLVPGHLSQFASDYSQRSAGFEQSHPACKHHDSRTCQICLTGGHLVALGTAYAVEINFDAVAPVVFEIPSLINCLTVDLLPARAPPSLV